MSTVTPPVAAKTGGPCVYFVQAATGGPIKIGVAYLLKDRLKSLQAQSPIPLVCLGWMPGYTKQEQELHAQFGASRLHGEWFEPTADLLAFIQSLNPENWQSRRLSIDLDRQRSRSEYSTLRAELRKTRSELEEATRNLERVRETRRRTQWRVYGLDPAAELTELGEDLVDGDADERLIETENEVRLTLFWDDGEKKFAIRVLEGDAEFTDKAWERIVEAAMVYADSLNASLHAADVVW